MVMVEEVFSKQNIIILRYMSAPAGVRNPLVHPVTKRIRFIFYPDEHDNRTFSSLLYV